MDYGRKNIYGSVSGSGGSTGSGMIVVSKCEPSAVIYTSPLKEENTKKDSLLLLCED